MSNESISHNLIKHYNSSNFAEEYQIEPMKISELSSIFQIQLFMISQCHKNASLEVVFGISRRKIEILRRVGAGS